jgi:hypothetical protein
MIARSKHYRARSHHRDRPRGPQGELLDQRSEDLRRTVAVHLAGHNFDVARLVIDRAEREWQEEQRRPESLDALPLEDLGLGNRTYAALADEPLIRNAGDLMGMSEEKLLEICMIGPGAIKDIRDRCNYWLTKIARAM